MKVKTWKTTMAALMGLFILAGCGNGTTEDSSAADGSAESDAFVVGMEAGYPPFNWTQNDDSNGAVKIDGADGYANGYDVQMAQKVADGLGKELVIVKTEWDGLVPALVSSKIDAIVAGMSPTDERKEAIDFSDSYYTTELVIVVKSDGAYANATTLADFADAKVTAQMNTLHYGVIDQIVAEAGQVVAAGQPVMRHSRSDTPEAAIAVPESRVPALRLRQNAEIGLWANEQAAYRGLLRELSPVADPATRTYAARVTILNPDERLRLGMTARVRFLSDGASPAPAARFSVPLTAIFQQAGSPAVWVVGADQGLSLRPVTVAAFGDKFAELSAGLAAGERIVVAGVHKLAAGEKIKAVDQASGQ